jgi:alpha-1,2-mannosyltransferase
VARTLDDVTARGLVAAGPAERRRAPAGLLAALAVVLVVAGIASAYWMLSPHDRKWDLIDLAVYRAAADALVDGHSVFGDQVREQLRIPLPFIYPPVAAVLALPFALLPETPANLAWTALTLLALAATVRVCFARVLPGGARAALPAVALATAAMAALSPVEDHLRFGQVGIFLMACCVYDCAAERTRWPRGLLVGAATAVKLVPGIFIPYLLFTRRTRAAVIAAATAAAFTVVGAVVAPSDSWSFFTDRMFEPTSPEFFSNQSIQGVLQRTPGPWELAWFPLAGVVLVYGLARAAAVSRAGDELRGIAITGLVGLLVSPISWIHHWVWIVPVVAVVLGRATDLRRVAAAFVVAAVFVARLPYVGNEELGSTGLGAWLLESSYCLVGVALFVWLTGAAASARPRHARPPSRGRLATTTAAHPPLARDAAGSRGTGPAASPPEASAAPPSARRA